MAQVQDRMITNFATQYLPPLLLTIIIALAIVLLFYWLSRQGIRRPWDVVVRYRGPLGFLFGVILFVVAFGTFLTRTYAERRFYEREEADLTTASNLIANPLFAGGGGGASEPIAWTISGTLTCCVGSGVELSGYGELTSSTIAVRPGYSYRYSLFADGEFASLPAGEVQVRLIWLDPALRIISWDDSPVEEVGRPISGVHKAPPGATRLRFQIRNPDESAVIVERPKLSQVGVYVEPHSNATTGSIAFSFDWESAMGGAIHSKGDEVHDVASATQRGLEHREGADWLNKLFASKHISATFYGTGYNLLDGNTEQRTFNGDPTYEWAAPENGWASEYWLTHRWFSDDPFGTYESDPGWYFGDQTRVLLGAGHEIAPHTFAHVYVRGSNPEELATDLDEWIKYAAMAGVPPPTTFAFPWRSSNSLTKEFYDVLYSRGIRAVTRIYPPDMKDLYTLGNAVVYTDIRQAQLYPDMPVMPDFLLGSPSTSAGEEAGGAPIGREQGLVVIKEAIARRGTTSFWQHPEQLADEPVFSLVRDAWRDVVGEAARERDNGRLWIATVADITNFQRDITSVSADLHAPGLFGGKWRIEVRNDSGKELQGVTLTLPAEASGISGQITMAQSVSRAEPEVTRLSAPGAFAGPSRQIVLARLAPGTTTIEVEWVEGQEPIQ